jgi:hypothetical protein
MSLSILNIDQDAILLVIYANFDAATRNIETEIANYRDTLCTKQISRFMKTMGFKFYERHQLFQYGIRDTLQQQIGALQRLQGTCRHFRHLYAVAKIRCTQAETLIINKLTIVTYLYRNTIKNYFRTAAHHILHTS